jgi:hypothetical protein
MWMEKENAFNPKVIKLYSTVAGASSSARAISLPLMLIAQRNVTAIHMSFDAHALTRL